MIENIIVLLTLPVLDSIIFFRKYKFSSAYCLMADLRAWRVASGSAQEWTKSLGGGIE